MVKEKRCTWMEVGGSSNIRLYCKVLLILLKAKGGWSMTLLPALCYW